MISDSERAYLADLVMLQIENDSSNSSYIIYPDELQETYGLSREDADAVLDAVLLYEELLYGYYADIKKSYESKRHSGRKRNAEREI